MKVYISGPMIGKDYRNRFAMAQVEVEQGGNVVVNPAKLVTPSMTRKEYQEATEELFDKCDTILFLSGWKDVVECNAEMARAINNKMIITFEGGKGCQSPSRQEPEISQKKPAKKFMSVIKGAFSAGKGITSRRR